MNASSSTLKRASKPLRLGFVALSDCAPIVMAQELGLYERQGLSVEMTREVGWATVRDKIIYRELDAAHALAPMVFAANFGLGSIQADCLTGLVLSLEGNAITVSRALWDAGGGEKGELRVASEGRAAPLIFGVPFLYSCHTFLLRAWFRSRGLRPERDIQLVVVPPPQMPANLKAGHLDGYCVGEPWNSVAVAANFGWRAAVSADLAPGHPEKVLMVRRDFAESRRDEHERLIAALLEACRFCAAPENRQHIAETLSAPRYVNARADTIFDSLDRGDTASLLTPDAHEPTAEQAAWTLAQMVESGHLSEPRENRREIEAKVFRADIFRNAARLHSTTTHSDSVHK